jgi:beta-lactamase class C
MMVHKLNTRLSEIGIAMHRRNFFICGTAAVLTRPLFAMLNDDKFLEVSNLLTQATTSGQVRAAAIYARIGKSVFHRAYGDAKSTNASFLLGSISKPIAVAGLMALYDQGQFQLNEPVTKYIPEFSGGLKEQVTIQHLLTGPVAQQR